MKPQHVSLDTVDLPKIELDQIATILYDGSIDDRQKAILRAVTQMAAAHPKELQLSVTVRVMPCGCTNRDCGSAMLLCEMGPPAGPANWFGMFRLVPTNVSHDDRPPPGLQH